MKQVYTLVVFAIALLISFAANSQEDADITSKKKQNNPSVDTRVDNMGYWMKKAEGGLVPYNPSIPVKPATFKGSSLSGKGLMVTDSPDVPVTSATNVTESENSVFVDPNDNQYVLNSNNSTAWNGSSVTGLYGANYFQTSNGGASWFGSAGGAGGSNSGDPTTAINHNGRQFVNYISSSSGQGISYSDNGTSWTAVTIAPNPGSLADKNHMWIDNSLSSLYEGNLYTAWTPFGGSDDAEIVISRSTNDGLTWSSPLNISSAVSAGSHNQGVNIQTGPNGEVYAVWAIYDSWPSNETAIGMAKSTNGGASYGAATRIITGINGVRNAGLSKNHRVNSFPSMAVDIGSGPNSGNMYVVWANYGDPNNGNSGSNASVYMSRSTNGGNTWSAPIRVNQGPFLSNYEAYFPWITCDPETGVIAVVYYDDRDISSHPTGDVETWVAYSFDAGNTWTDMRVSDVSFTPTAIPGLASGYMGDYLGITSKGGIFYPCWVDNRGSTYMTYVSPFILGLNAGFTANQTSVCTGGTVTFTDVSTGSPTSWSWSFPGGSPSSATGAGPHTITYNTPGTYNVSLTVGDGSTTDTETATGYITVENIIADFSGSPTTVVQGNTVTFTDNSSCSPTTWNWSFSGGSPATASGPGPHTITYNTIGVYDVTLTSSNASYSDTETKTGYIDVITCNYCATYYSNTADDYISNVSFNTINNNSGSTNYTDFTAISTNVTLGNTYTVSMNITVNGSWVQHGWVWFDWNRDCDFDDSGEAFDLGQTPGSAGTFTLSGSITVPSGASLGSTRMRVSELYAADPGPCTNSTYGEAEDYTVVIQSNLSPPVADFTADDTTPAVGQQVNFTDISSSSPTSFAWSFSPATVTYLNGTNSASQNPEVSFDASGYYTVTLAVTNGFGSDSETKTNYILAGTPGNWTGNLSADWNEGANWEVLVVPASTDDVTIPATAPNWPLFSGDFELGIQCNDMYMVGSSEFTATGDLSITPGRLFSCSGSATIYVGADWNNNGNFTPGTSQVIMDGTLAGNIDALGTESNGLQTTFAAGNGSNGNMFDIRALNEVTITSFEGNLDSGTGDVHIYYKTGTYVGYETNSSAWTYIGTASVTSSGVNVPTAIPIAVNVTIPATQTYAFYVHAENGNNYTNGSGVGNVYAADANIQVLEGCGKGNPLFTGGTYQPRIFNGIVNYDVSSGAGSATYYDLTISKTDAAVVTSVDVNVTGNLTVKPGAQFTNSSGISLDVTGNMLLEGDATDKASFIDQGTTTVGGSTTVQSYYADNRWHFISSPVSNALSGVLLGIYLKVWDEATYTWSYITPTTDPLGIGTGYEIWSTLGNPIVEYTGGTANSGNISPTLSATDVNGGGIGNSEGWNFVGNPYPSAIDWGTGNDPVAGYVRTNIDETIYIWNGSQYATFNPNLLGGAGLGTNGGTRYIQSMQSFFVKASSFGPAITIPNAARVHNTQANLKIVENETQYIHLSVEGFNDRDEVLVEVNTNATNGFDSQFDAYKLWGSDESPQLYIREPGTDLSVHVVPEINTNDVIELGFKPGTAGSYTVTAEQLEQFESYEVVILHDLLTGIKTDLKVEAAYTFESSPEDDPNRFKIYFTTDVNDIQSHFSNNVKVYSMGNDIHVEINSDFENYHLTVFDMSGQLLGKMKLSNHKTNTFTVRNGKGFYLTKVESSQSVISDKVLIK